MPFPGPAFRRMVQMHQQELPVERRDDSTSSQYGNSITYSDAGTRLICMAGIEESQQMTGAGEREAERAVAYTTADIDLQINDRITYGGETYEVLTKSGMEEETNPAVYRYELDNDV